nr:hypothetical protein [Tanacetum cinerariifolium]
MLLSTVNPTSLFILQLYVSCATCATSVSSSAIFIQTLHFLGLFSSYNLRPLIRLAVSCYPVEFLGIAMVAVVGELVISQVVVSSSCRVYADLHVGSKEVSSYTTYTFNDAGKEAYN